MNTATTANLAAIQPALRATRAPATSRVILSLADGYNRWGDAELDLAVVDDVAFDGDTVHFSEALGDAGYRDLVDANWIDEGKGEWRTVVAGRIYVAEVVS